MNDLIMATTIAHKVDALGGQTYFVGGYVRDKILDRTNKDIDIEVHGITSEQLCNILSGLGTVKTQGASFGVYNLKGYDIDIAQPRMETVTGRGHKDFEVFVDPFIGTEKAAKRRDFTMNALMENVLTGEIIDHFGGISDLQNGIIRHVDDVTFKEDPLRVLRAAQFAARFGFDIAPETKDIMRSMDLSTLSKERVYGEMEKALLKSDKPSIFFESLRDVNQLDHWFPETKALIGCSQNANYHSEGDVWEHTMHVIDSAATIKTDTTNPEFFMVSALCHDFGKPVSMTVDDNGIVHSYGHEEAGVPVAEGFVRRLNNDVKLREYVTDMVCNHMKPHMCFNNQSSLKSSNRMFDACKHPDDLIRLVKADSEGKDFVSSNIEYGFLSERLHAYKMRMKEPEITGADLIALGMKPGPMFSEVLEHTHKLHLSYVDKDKALKDTKTNFEKYKRKQLSKQKSIRSERLDGLLSDSQLPDVKGDKSYE